MPEQWTHPKLGKFVTCNFGCGWICKRNVPAFAAFCYDTGYPNARRSSGNITVGLSAWLMNEIINAPTPGMIAVAEKILDEPEVMVEKVIAALWDDFNGRGPNSGAWWHSNIKSIHKIFEQERLAPPVSAHGLLNVLQLCNVSVYDKSFEANEPIGWLNFNAAFEGEHGLSILTDGEQILGMGYSGEASPWITKRQKLRKTPTNPFKNG